MATKETLAMPLGQMSLGCRRMQKKRVHWREMMRSGRKTFWVQDSPPVYLRSERSPNLGSRTTSSEFSGCTRPPPCGRRRTSRTERSMGGMCQIIVGSVFEPYKHWRVGI